MSTDLEQEIHRCAAYVVGRNCYFAGLAIVMIALCFADKPALALDLAGILNVLMTTILLMVAVNAARPDHRRSEIYALLSARGISIHPETARSLVAMARRDTCLHFARYAGGAAAMFLAMGILWAVIHPSANPMNAEWGMTDVPYGAMSASGPRKH